MTLPSLIARTLQLRAKLINSTLRINQLRYWDAVNKYNETVKEAQEIGLKVQTTRGNFITPQQLPIPHEIEPFLVSIPEQFTQEIPIVPHT